MNHKLSSAELIHSLQDTRQKTLDLIGDLSDEQLNVPMLEIINPPLWELGHITFFYEIFLLRSLKEAKPYINKAEELYESFQVNHDSRWELELPDRKDTLDYMETILSRLIDWLNSNEPDARETYLFLISILHEDMHVEALTYTRQTLGYTKPKFSTVNTPDDDISILEPVSGDVDIPGGTFMLGASPDAKFTFDNEKWAHPVEIKPLKIARTTVTNHEFTAFVNAGGYENTKYWSYGGRVWLRKTKSKHPFYWQREDNRWMQKHFDKYIPLDKDLPVIHINWYEAEAYCNWSNRRLPTEAEWELAASSEITENKESFKDHKRLYPWGDAPGTQRVANIDSIFMDCVDVMAFPAGDSPFGCRQMIGNVWEWTSSPFYPFPGYIVDQPYKEYSAPWFGDRKVLRGGSWASSSRIVNNTYRNFFLPYRYDIFAGFRTCAK